MNLLWTNRKKQLVIDRIKQIDPDVISLAETSDGWNKPLAQLAKRWPYLAHCPEWHVRGGVKIYSKWRLDQADFHCGFYGSFLKTSAVLEDGSKLVLGSVHPRWPWPASGPEMVDKMLPVLAQTGPDALIAGDFNATTWSWSVQRFAQAGNLQVQSGIGATWMFGNLPAPVVQLVGLPIDNVLYKGRVRVLSSQTLEEMGSDHLPILTRFQIR